MRKQNSTDAVAEGAEKSVVEAGAWAARAFGGDPAVPAGPIALDLLFAAGETPFSFRYGGAASADLLGTWAHTLETRDTHDFVQYTASWKEARTALRVTATVKCFKKFPAVDWVLHLENQGRQDTPLIEDIQALDVGLNTGARATTLHRIKGDDHSWGSFWQLEFPVEAGNPIRLAPMGGRSSNGTFPFFNLACGEQGLFVAIGWSGQWAATLERGSGDTTGLTAGMEKTRLVLHPGEKIRTPRILVLGWEGDRLAAHNRFRRLMLAHYSPTSDGKRESIPAFWQCFDRYQGNSEWKSEAGQIHAAKVAKASGCDFLWLDAAWFLGDVGNWTPHAGFPNGLKPVSDACHEIGMKFMAWFEPERVGRGTRIADEHPEFVHGGTNGGLFKLDDPAARRWMTDLLNRRIKEYGLDWYRNDFNMDPLDSWLKNDAPDRQGMTEIRYIEGLYAMWDEMLAANPGLVIDNCASGGRRIDLETCSRSVVLWQSDINCHKGSEDAHQSQNVCLSLYIPLHTPCAWNADAYELRSVVTAGLVTQFAFLDPGFSAEKARALVDEVKEYRKFWYGDLYPLTVVTPNAGTQMAFELYRPDLKEGLVMCFRRPEDPQKAVAASLAGDGELLLKLQGLDAGREYRVWSVEGLVPKTKVRGSDLMAKGLTIRLPGPRTSDVIRFRDSMMDSVP